MKTKIRHFIHTINIFKKIANKKIKIKYLLLTLAIFALIAVALHVARSIRAKNGALNNPQTILIKSDATEDTRPENQIVPNNSIIITIEYGKNIFSQFTDNNFSPEDVRQVINEMNLNYDLRKLKPGQQFKITFDSEFFYEEKIMKNQTTEQDKKKNNSKNINKKKRKYSPILPKRKTNRWFINSENFRKKRKKKN
jgi:hypothetical protein